MSRSGGFSLIELLVVIGIIALLAAILFPVFSKVREKSRQATCGSNLRQITLGVLQYVQDSDECLPFLAYNDHNHLGDDWQTTTMPYTKSVGIWQCPDASAYVTSDAFCRSFGAPFLLQPSGYAYNETAAAQTTPGQIDADGPTNGKTFAPATLGKCEHPAQTFLVMDKGAGAVFSPWVQWQMRAQSTALSEDNYVAGPHTDGKNVAFADGHLKYVKTAAIVTQDQIAASGVSPVATSPYYSYFTN